MSLRSAGTALLACLLALPAAAGELPWEEIYVEDGVTVHRAEVEDSKLFAFKGTKVMKGTRQDVLGVLLDNEHRINWVDRLATNYILQLHTPYDYVLYQNFELPALFSDRDYVYRGRVVEDEGSGVVTLSMQSIEHDKAPPTTGVRAELINSRYVLTPLDSGDTQVEVEIITDPKGMMPSWLVNMIQKDWPRETLTRLEGEFAKDYHAPHPLPSEARAAEEEALRLAKEAEEAEVKAAADAAVEEDTGSPVEPAPGEAEEAAE